MSINSNTLIDAGNVPVGTHNFIHEIISCEKVALLASEHQELCVGLCAVLNGGASLPEVQPLLIRLMEQSEVISSLLTHKRLIESMGFDSIGRVSQGGDPL
jgi:hypothetical protein